MMTPSRSLKSKIQWSFAIFGIGAALGGMTGCKPSARESTTVAAAPADSGVPADSVDAPPVASPVPGAPVAPEPAEPARSDPAQLEREFFASTDADARGEVAEKLWDLNTPQAVATLQRLFNADASVDVKVDLVSGLLDAEPSTATRDARWSLLLTALSATQPAAVREVAVEILAGSEDPRALPVLQSFANDANEDVREAVATAIKERRGE